MSAAELRATLQALRDTDGVLDYRWIARMALEKDAMEASQGPRPRWQLRASDELVLQLSFVLRKVHDIETDLVEIRVALEEVRPEAEHLVKMLGDVKGDPGIACAQAVLMVLERLGPVGAD